MIPYKGSSGKEINNEENSKGLGLLTFSSLSNINKKQELGDLIGKIFISESCNEWCDIKNFYYMRWQTDGENV